MRQIIRSTLLVGCLFFVLLIGGTKDEVGANTWEDAYSFYQVYQNEVVFCPLNATDGTIFYCTRANSSTSSIRFRTIGWKMTFYDKKGACMQTLYYKLDGAFLAQYNTKKVGEYKYNLYSVKLSAIKRRVSKSVLAAMENGALSLKLDACMVVVKNNVEQGKMNDNGPTSGTVYTTYAGIVKAQNWSEASKESLKRYFNKQVEGLFHEINLIKTEGIKSVTGGGTYCYGTYIGIDAAIIDGYEFSHWSGRNVVQTPKHSFYVTKSETWKAYAQLFYVEVIYHKTNAWKDYAIKSVIYTSTTKNRALLGEIWSRTGYRQVGWSDAKIGNGNQYPLGANISIEWIRMNSPKVELYAVWERIEENGPKITATDLYFSLNQAKAGMITEEKIASTASAHDVEDGEILFGHNEENLFEIVDYQENDYRNLHGSANITQTFRAVDKDGHLDTKQIWVHIVDTSPHIDSYENGKWRFIREDMYSYLPNNSIWRKREEFHDLLVQMLGWQKEISGRQ